MPSRSRAVRELVGRVAASARWNRSDVGELQRRLEIERIADRIERFCHSVPLHDDEYMRLVDVLAGAPAEPVE